MQHLPLQIPAIPLTVLQHFKKNLTALPQKASAIPVVMVFKQKGGAIASFACIMKGNYWKQRRTCFVSL